MSGITSETACTGLGTIGGQTPQWSNWTRGLDSNGLCTVSFSSYSTCTAADARLVFWPGSTWTTPLFNIQSFCESFGRCDTLAGLFSKQSCEELSHCVGNEALTDQASCEAQGQCNDFNGCIFPLRNNTFNCEMPLRWTPIGCRDLTLSTQVACQGANG